MFVLGKEKGEGRKETGERRGDEKRGEVNRFDLIRFIAMPIMVRPDNNILKTRNR